MGKDGFCDFSGKVGTGATDSNADVHGWRFLAGCFKWGCACLAGWSGDSWPSPPDDGFVAKGGFRDFWNQGKVPLGVYQGASSRGGEASQVLWVVPAWQEGGGAVMVGQGQDDGFVGEG